MSRRGVAYPVANEESKLNGTAGSTVQNLAHGILHLYYDFMTAMIYPKSNLRMRVKAVEGTALSARTPRPAQNLTQSSYKEIISH